MKEPKEQIYEQFARIAKALASPPRLEILDLLSQGEKSVERVAAQARLGVKNASAHLRALREARLVETRREATRVFYRLADERVERVVRDIQTLARQRLAEVERISRLHFESSSELEGGDGEELLRRLEAGEVTLLDVRPRDEYQAGHIPGALSLPIDELERRLSELPRDRPVVAYCRGPWCRFAADAVARLRARGYSAVRMVSGVSEWRLAGRVLQAAPARQRPIS